MAQKHTKWTKCYKWYVYLPLGFKRLNEFDNGTELILGHNALVLTKDDAVFMSHQLLLLIHNSDIVRT